MTGARRASPVVRWAFAVAACLVALAVLVAWLNVRGEAPLMQDDTATGPDAIERGAYLARAGNCVGCHTAAGGEALAGGRGIETPFGPLFSPNITPDADTGIGRWTAAEFRRALHNGRSKDGRLLYPAFPYPSFTRVTRGDSDALYAYLRGVKPVRQANRPHGLRFPYNTQAALAVWRALFFRPGGVAPEPGQSAEWHRGRYLVQGLGHCAACHSTRNFLGAAGVNAEFAGGLMPSEAWYAPSLASPSEAGVQDWPLEQAARLLKTGVSPGASVAGPMAEVVYSSTQHLTEQDVRAMAVFLASIPRREPPAKAAGPTSMDQKALGEKLYQRHCASCHGDAGQGVAPFYPALAGNRAVTLDAPNNVVQVIRRGGFAPGTAGNPRPFGMPPFGQVLGNDEIAAVATYVRQAWGNSAGAVLPLDVHRIR